MALSDDHACAKLTDDSIWCWGSSYHGQSRSDVVGGSDIPVSPLLP